MTIKEMRILFAGQTSDEYGTFKGFIGSTNTESNDEDYELVTTTNSFKDTWDFHYKRKSNPLQFPITLIKTDGTYFNAYEERAIKKWLVKEKREWLQIDQDDLSDVYFYCHLINPRKVDVGGNNAGLSFDVICDAPFAWSGLIKKTYFSTNTLNFNFNSVVDFDDYIIYPQLTIISNDDQTIKINNNTTNESIELSNCTVGETIYIDCKTDKIKNSNNTVMLDRWVGKQTVGFIEGLNSISLVGNFSLTLSYRLPIRVGG